MQERDSPLHYEIQVEGILDERWSAWFDGLNVTSRTDGTTVIAGPVADQAALHGLLMKAHGLGLSLVAVRRVDTDTQDEKGDAQS